MCALACRAPRAVRDRDERRPQRRERRDRVFERRRRLRFPAWRTLLLALIVWRVAFLAFRLIDGELPQVTQPLLLLRSARDHVVPPMDSARILSRVSSTDVTEIVLEQSCHVATLDHDADRIFEESLGFIDRLATGVGKEGTTTGG